MLTKEECLKALDILTKHECCCCDFEDDECLCQCALEQMLNQLIEEHFELLEKYKNLQDENARLNFNNIANNINDMNYKLWLENLPLTIEEIKTIKAGTWLWDDLSKSFRKFMVTDTDTVDKCKCFFENRFYRKQVEECKM